MIEKWQLQQRMGQPLDIKIQMSLARIKAWYDHYDGEVVVSFSGGMDSTVLLHLVRSAYPEVPAMFVKDLPYPEIWEHVQNTENVEVVRPKMTFEQVIDRYGYPIISKRVADYIKDVRNARSETNLKKLRLTGIKPDGRFHRQGMIPLKWQYLLSAPFKISDRCCDILKKDPFNKGLVGRYPLLGIRVDEGEQRELTYRTGGCNGFNLKRPRSWPIAFWTEEDIWEYVHHYNVPYSRIYDMGYRRTGCFACMFGVHLEDEPNRFQLMQKTHPGLWRYCQRIGIPEVLDYIGVNYKVEDGPSSV